MTTAKTAAGPAPANPLLEGIRVIDLSRLLPGPFCTLYLAQLGAEVIKIESPDGGDYARALSPELFALVNRGKQSVVLDLRSADGVEALKRLVAESDVLVESFRPGVMDAMGCGYEALRDINPRLVYASLTGYGQTGPYRDRAGHDMNYLAYAGVLDQQGEAGGAPVLSNVQLADLGGGALTCAVGILSAVIGARSSGHGAWVDVAMLDGSFALQTVALATLHASGRAPQRGADMLSGALPNYRLYRCRDGRHLAVGALEPKFFRCLLTALGEDLPAPLRRLAERALRGGAARPGASTGDEVGDMARGARSAPRGRRWPLLHGVLAVVFRLRTRDQWAARLAECDACVSPVLALDEALDNEQLRARGMVDERQGRPVPAHPIRFVGAQTVDGEAPALGEHTEAVLSALGLASGR